MSTCANCDTKIGNPLIGKEIKKLDKSSLDKLNDFLPESLRRPSFCQKCLNINFNSTIGVEGFNIVRKLEVHHATLREISKKVSHEINNLKDNINNKKGELYPDFSDKMVLYSCYPSNLELIGFVESFMIVDSGMWSTSSDNLDVMWSVIHDRTAREGFESDKKLSKGFDNIKILLKKASFIEGGNSVVDVKYSFSELAGNGKILMHCQGTAAIDKKNPVPDFSYIHSEFEETKRDLEDKIKNIEQEISEKSIHSLKEVVKELKFE